MLRHNSAVYSGLMNAKIRESRNVKILVRYSETVTQRILDSKRERNTLKTRLHDITNDSEISRLDQNVLRATIF